MRSFWMRRIFEDLDTTSSQEREIKSAIDDVERVARETRRELGDARGELGRAFEAESLNEIALGELSVRADKATATMKEAFEAALRRIHATLDPKQRAIVADLLTRGPRRSTAYRGSF